MVLGKCIIRLIDYTVSVLALSSRFDGQLKKALRLLQEDCFSTRSVESF